MADYIRPTPRNPILGLLADALTGGVDWMRDPRRAQQMQGLGGLLAETGIPATMERLSYGEPLTKGKGMTTRLRPEAEAALMTLGPEAVPIGRGAAAAVRATKGLPVGAATVYHGSPYRFERFDPTKIGSGEGAQAYGYGHYVAESPGVAATYRDMLAGKEQDLVNNAIQRSVAFGNSPRDALILEGFPKDKISPDLEKSFRKIVEGTNADGTVTNAAIREYQNLKKLVPAEGSLYTIDLPDPAIARMLDWDKPLAQQPESVRAALQSAKEKQVRAIVDYASSPYLTPGLEGEVKTMGEAIKLLGMNASPAKGSALLAKQGIPGIRYLDQGSRGTGQGTSNFVVFPGEEDLLRILNVEGGLLAP